MSIVVYLFIIACLILFPDYTADTARNALILWSSDLVPVLYPYMVFSRILCAKLRAYRMNPAPCIAILGLLGGSPSGASILLESSDKLSQRALYTLCALTGTISPMFLIGTISSWTHDSQFSWMLLASHWTGASLSALCAALLNQKQVVRSHPPASCTSDNKNPFLQSADSIIQVGGCIICYSVLASLITLLPWVKGIWSDIVHAVLEVTGGVHALCQSTIPLNTRQPLLAALCGFGGLSILTQNHSFLQHAGLSIQRLLLFALLRAAGAGISMYIFQIVCSI